MNKTFLLVAVTALGVAGCKPKIEPAESAQQGAAPAPQVDTAKPDAAVATLPKTATPERIAEIVASGRTGLWSDVTEVCRGQHPKAVLTWNVREAADGAQRVIVYVIDKNGTERNFGQGGLVGEKQTGPWLSPGTTFKLRSSEEKKELASLVVGEKTC